MAQTDIVERVNMTFPILKMEETSDGDLIVYGKATDASIDSDDQIVDSAWSAKALEDWLKSGGNIRVQHSPYLYPAGKGLEVHTSDDGHYVKALVVEETAKNLVKKGVLQAYSVGIGRPKIVRDVAAKGGRIVDGVLIEISLVDRPANANCGFTIAKSANGTVVDAEEVFGDIAAALAAVESKVDTAIEEHTKEADTAFRSSTKSELLESTVELSPEDITEYLEARTQFLDTFPEGEGPDVVKSRSDWQAQKDLFYNGTANARALWIAKRDFDRGVGGGTDRDKIAPEDFAGPGKTFPIVTPKDVEDAARLVGHADDPGAVRQSIVTIAHRKGPDFVAALPDDWKKGDDATKSDVPDVEKGQKDCPKCGKGYDGDSKQRNCEKCGADLPQADASKSDSLRPGDAGKPDFDGGDGDGLGEDGLGVKPTAHMDNNASSGLQPGSLSYAGKRLHDITCGVYSDEVLFDEYATMKSLADGINVEAVRAEFGDEMAELAAAVKATDPELLADARAGLHKGFTQDYPNTSVSPSTMEPGRFRRGFLSAGHYRQNATGADSGARIPAGNRTIDADQFSRDSLSAGHQRPSPAGSGDNAVKGLKEMASAAYTRNQLNSIHDHIHERRPDVCAWQPTAEHDNRADATLTPVHPNIPSGPKSADVELLKAQVSEMLSKMSYYEEENATLKAQVAELGAQPDPALAPVRGVVAKSAGVGQATPVEKTASTEAIEMSYEDKIIQYAEKTRFSGDPLVRKRSEEVLAKYRKNAD